MITARCDHALHYHDDKIYAMGGMNLNGQSLQTLTACEVYSVENDSWTEIAPFNFARQQHSVCHFNDKFLFIFGGKKVLPSSTVLPKDVRESSKINFFEPFEFVKEVEVYEIGKGTWKTINYISEPERLTIISSGSMQISGS